MYFLTRLLMFKAQYSDGQWHAGEMLPYQAISIDPAAKVLHYAQEVFEGMKVYWVDNPQPSLFRPRENWMRMNTSAKRLCMPAIPEALFMSGVKQVAQLCRSLIPRESGTSLYLRPFMIGTEADLGLGASKTYEFYIIASPSEAYQTGSMRVLVERQSSRTAAGDMGAAKAGSNYAAALEASGACVNRGYNQILWLNSEVRGQIDELSGMNVFAIIDGELHTPALNGSILPGITRSSILSLAPSLGLSVQERNLSIDELLSAIDCGRCTEAFACGTAAIISPISCIGDQGRIYAFEPDGGKQTARLYNTLLGIQEGRLDDEQGWLCGVEDEQVLEVAG